MSVLCQWTIKRLERYLVMSGPVNPISVSGKHRRTGRGSNCPPPIWRGPDLGWLKQKNFQKSVTMNKSLDISVHSGCHIYIYTHTYKHRVQYVILIPRFFLTKLSSRAIRADRLCPPPKWLGPVPLCWNANPQSFARPKSEAKIAAHGSQFWTSVSVFCADLYVSSSPLHDFSY